MDTAASGILTGLGVVWVLGFVVLALALLIAWIILPFALIGTKPLLRELLAEQRKTNALLAAKHGGDALADRSASTKQTVTLR